MSNIKFNIKDYKLHNNEQKLVMLEYKGKFNEIYEALGTGFVLASEQNKYNDYVILTVIDKADNVSINKGDMIITKMCYLASIKDLFEGYSGEYDNYYIIPERLIEGVVNNAI